MALAESFRYTAVLEEAVEFLMPQNLHPVSPSKCSTVNILLEMALKHSKMSLNGNHPLEHDVSEQDMGAG